MISMRKTSAEDVRTALWFWPLVAVVGTVLLTLVLLNVRADPATSSWARWAWPGGSDAASTLLQVVATAVMTATTLTFSITIVALQLASQQFSPRLLREFARDRVTQAVLALLVSTFAAAVVGLRGMNPEEPLPVLHVHLVLVLGIASALGVLVFVGHLVRSLRVDTMMVAVHQEAAAVIDDAYPPLGDRSKKPDPGLPGPRGGELVLCRRSGFIRTIDPEGLADVLGRHGVLVWLGIRPGDSVVMGSPLASVFVTGDDRPDLEALGDELVPHIEVGYERTSEQDAALGLRQLVDIAVKAISPSINDPVTAAHSVSYCADLLVRLQGRELGPQAHTDGAGVVRVVTPDRDHRYYLDLVCAPVRRFGEAEPLVLEALLRLLRDCAVSARTAEQCDEIARQVDLLLEQMDDHLLPTDADSIRDSARRVHLALAGDLEAAYDDRAGETRSV